ncbi:succinate--CoA ligase subunit alpha [archaeon]|nr:succinate--CoA ligase subunit alpha [archaeon]
MEDSKIMIEGNIIVQGLGKQGLFHLERMLKYGTKVVAGVNPNLKGCEVPVYKTVKEALVHDVSWSVIFVPARFAKDACIEALEENLNICIITEGIPVNDMIKIIKHKKDRKIIGPNCPGVCSVGKSKLGIMPNHLFKEGKVGIVSRSGTLTYEIVDVLSKNGIGQSSVVGIGGDMVIGMDFIDVLKEFEKDEDTSHIVLLGEIGGDLEERAAEYIKDNVSKPVIAYIAGKQAPKGKTMGHAGAVVYGNRGTAESKVKALKENGVKVVDLPSEIVNYINK